MQTQPNRQEVSTELTCVGDYRQACTGLVEDATSRVLATATTLS